MFRRISLVVALALLLIYGVAPTAAQDRSSPKDVPFIYGMYETCGGPSCTLRTVMAMWNAPEKAPDSYRVSWTTTGKWRSNKKPNTKKAGNAIVTGRGYCIRGLEVAPGETLRIRVRARYDGKRNGPWNCCLEITNG